MFARTDRGRPQPPVLYELSTVDLLERASFHRNDSFTEEHHYLSSTRGRVAKLFAGPNVEATEQEQMFKALNQCLNSLITLRSVSRLVPDLPDRSLVRAVLNYPVIVCNHDGMFFTVDIEDASPSPQPAAEQFLFEINYAWLNSAKPKYHGVFLG